MCSNHNDGDKVDIDDDNDGYDDGDDDGSGGYYIKYL